MLVLNESCYLSTQCGQPPWLLVDLGLNAHSSRAELKLADIQLLLLPASMIRSSSRGIASWSFPAAFPCMELCPATDAFRRLGEADDLQRYVISRCMAVVLVSCQ